jgi:hypothetical protein
MKAQRRWSHAALGAIALVITVVAFGVLLEHTVGPTWASRGGARGVTAITHAPSHSSATRIPPGVKQQLRDGRRLGARYGGSDFSNVGDLRRAVIVQLVIAAIVVALMMTWRGMRRTRTRARHTRNRPGWDAPGV